MTDKWYIPTLACETPACELPRLAWRQQRLFLPATWSCQVCRQGRAECAAQCKWPSWTRSPSELDCGRCLDRDQLRPETRPDTYHNKWSKNFDKKTAPQRVFTKIAPSPKWIWAPPNTWFLGPSRVRSPHWHVNQFNRLAQLMVVSKTDRQTHRPRKIGNKRLHLCTRCMQCDLITPEAHLQFHKDHPQSPTNLPTFDISMSLFIMSIQWT